MSDGLSKEQFAEFVRTEIDKFLNEHGLKLVRTPIESDMERRAVCLRFAIDSKAWISLGKVSPDDPPESEQIVALARTFQEYIEGDA